MTDQKDAIAVAIKWLAAAVICHALATSPLVTLAVGYMLMPEVSTTPLGTPDDHFALVEQERASTLFPLAALFGVSVLFIVFGYRRPDSRADIDRRRIHRRPAQRVG